LKEREGGGDDEKMAVRGEKCRKELAKYHFCRRFFLLFWENMRKNAFSQKSLVKITKTNVRGSRTKWGEKRPKREKIRRWRTKDTGHLGDWVKNGMER